ncbi:MAG: nucleotidyltransferase family protein [Bacteroides sp.]|nr:nucleotidyltransferase family protein [Bacteroides sp.]
MRKKIDSIDTFFLLLRSGLYGSPIPENELPASIDWEAVCDLALKQTVMGFVIEAAQHLPEHLRPSAGILAKMKRYALSLIKTTFVLENAASRLVEFFNRYGVSGVVLKGIGVARYYRQPQMRSGGDIDFYVGKREYRKAIEACLKEGLIEKNPDVKENRKHFEFILDGVTIEVHRLAATLYFPWKNRRFQQWIISELEESPARRALPLGGQTVTLPPVDFDALYIFYHGWNHYVVGGVGLRQVCDWAMVISSCGDEIDTARLVANIRRFGLENGWKLFACIAVDRLGVPAEKMPLYDPKFSGKSEKILEEILRIGNFGYHSEEYKKMRGENFVGKRYAITKFKAITRSYAALFPVIPLEAMFRYFATLLQGPLNIHKRAKES